MPIQRHSLIADQAKAEETPRALDEHSGYRRVPSASRVATQAGVAPQRTVTQRLTPAVTAERTGMATSVVLTHAPAVPLPTPAVTVPSRPSIRRADTPPRLTSLPQLPRTTKQRMHVPTIHAADPTPDRGRHGTLKMGAVRPGVPPSSGRMLDELDFHDGDPAVALELGATPAGHFANETMAGPAPPIVHFHEASGTPHAQPQAPSGERPPVATSGVTTRGAFDPRPGIVAFAGFGFVPDSVLHTPAYALRVLMRSSILRRELALTRGRRPQDVWLYEAALRCAHPSSFAKGMALICLAISALFAAAVAGAIVLGG